MVKVEYETAGWRRALEGSGVRLTPLDLEQALLTLKEQVGVVNALTSRRFVELGLWQPKPLTPKQIHPVRETQLMQIAEKDQRRTLHPLFYTLTRLFPEREPEAGAKTIGDDVYWDVDAWLKDHLPLDEETLKNLEETTRDNLYHENIHRQYLVRRPSGAEAKFMAWSLYVMQRVITYPITSNPENHRAETAIKYIDFLKKVVQQGSYEIEIHGGGINISIGGKILAAGGAGIDEDIAYYETLRATDPGMLKSLKLRPADFPEDIRLLFEWFKRTYGPIQELEEKYGNEKLMRKYYTGYIYDLFIEDIPPKDLFMFFIELIGEVPSSPPLESVS
jgi:hypothetical protein